MAGTEAENRANYVYMQFSYQFRAWWSMVVVEAG
jgi:hypothetical protein